MPEFPIQTETEITLEDVSVVIVGSYTPERPAPQCFDHDNPAFSDPGDAEEIEIESVKLVKHFQDKNTKARTMTLKSDDIQFFLTAEGITQVQDAIRSEFNKRHED